MSYILTFKGHRFDFLNPTPDMIDIEDIAHSLAMKCRFNGHCKSFYSVAQHSALMVSMLGDDNAPLDLQRWALLHDAEEAYLPDVPRPIKPFTMFREHVIGLTTEKMGNPVAPKDGEILGEPWKVGDVWHANISFPWQAMASRIMLAVVEKFDLHLPFQIRRRYVEPDGVKAADLRMLATERRDLMGNDDGDGWDCLKGVTPWRERIEPWSDTKVAKEMFLTQFAKLFGGR